ncbi:G-type lectin S-receptor-like serine/threonine-protein kinase [Cinnamomum micranthum f. kanehirae]|uniref:G-type lectin S-receptor-like serine/threonine-protein kinase n=1 Tax=Cinnamomum micranthum f. kanehirae TaxID=337451 RepID=A0A443PS05_9MAGN|nr:G-type lectin S-receptor-like serine/threonine-protein kinase [Cinnamomum micranthum f. kanehirae]
MSTLYIIKKKEWLCCSCSNPTQKLLLDWSKCFHIVQGVAQGLHYLHHYLRLKVIHHDLKSPKYALNGIFSEKSDVSSFGVLVLEIVAWQFWNVDRAMEFIDASLGDSLVTGKVMKCIHIGVLCVQDDLLMD